MATKLRIRGSKTLALVVLMLAAGSTSAQQGWVGEVFFEWIDPDVRVVRSMAVFLGDLYAAASREDGVNIYVRAVTPPWVPSALDGFGNPSNTGARAMAVHTYHLGVWHTNLYVGTTNLTQGSQVWAFDGTNPWFQAASSGFGNSSNSGVTSLVSYSYDGSLWAGTNNNNGAEIHYFTGVTWVKSMGGGFGDPNNDQITSMVEHNMVLYAATLNGQTGGEIWSYDGNSWSNAVPLGCFSAGVTAMVSAGGALYASVHAPLGVQIWRVKPLPLTQVNSNGFGAVGNEASVAMVAYQGELHVGTLNPSSGAQIWRLRDGSWTQVNSSGFGDSNNWAIGSLGFYNNDLFAGTANAADGAQIWRYPLIFADNFETGDADAWSVVR